MPYEPFPSEPQPSLAPGTGSAIQTATDPEGNKWQFDDNKGNWVNLNTGEAVSPKVFAQMAGRTGDAARDTLALAQAMRQEEAALTSPRMRPRPVSPVPQTQMAPPAVAPVTATAPMGVPAPVMRPQDNPVIPPYSPQQVAEVAARKPVPSTQIPVTEGQQQFYRMQQADWLMRNRDMKPVDAMRMAGIATQAMTPYQQARVALERQKLQQGVVPKPMTANQQALDQHRRARLEFDKEKFEKQIEQNKGKWSETDRRQDSAIVSRMSTIQKQLDALDRPETLTPGDQAVKERLFSEYETLLDDRAKIATKYVSGSTAAAPAVTKPPTAMAGVSAAMPLPMDKRNLVPGRTYSSKKGLVKWTGDKFIPLE